MPRTNQGAKVNLQIANQSFQDVRIPLQWGDRLILQEPNRALSVVYLGGGVPTLEILRNQPAPGVGFLPTWSGFQILSFPRDVYEFNVLERSFSSPTLGLPDVQIDEFYVRVGAQIFPNLAGFGESAGLQVTRSGITAGEPMPINLATVGS